MSENAKRYVDGERVKIGTCESMYYLRFDQRPDVEYPWPVLSDDPEKLDPFLYRFPDPKEDGILPGDFDGAWGGIKLGIEGFWSTFEAGSVAHSHMQAHAHDGYVFNMPCPEGNPDMYVTKYDGTKPHRFRNGGITTVIINAQRWYAGRLVLVVQCAACRRSIRLQDLKDAQPILDAVKGYADGHRELATRDYLLGGPGTAPHIREQLKANELRDAAYWDEVAKRIVNGYNNVRES